jgi:hypothetical protein
VNPADLDLDFDVEVEVGLGVGRETERLMMMQAVLQIQEKLSGMGLGGYLVTPEKFFAVAKEITRAMGYTRSDQFFVDPSRVEPPPPPGPTNEEKLEQAKLQLEGEKAKITQHKNDVDALREQALAEYRLVDIREKMALEREKLAQEAMLAREKVAIESRTAIEVAEIQARSRAQVGAERAEQGDEDGTEE